MQHAQTRRRYGWWIPLVAAFGGITMAVWSQTGSGQPSTKNGEWPHYTADLKGSKYSPLDQINASNFNNLEVAWRFKTDNLGTRPEYKLEGTPLMIKGSPISSRPSRGRNLVGSIFSSPLTGLLDYTLRL